MKGSLTGTGPAGKLYQRQEQRRCSRGEADDAGGAETGGPATVKNVGVNDSLKRIVGLKCVILSQHIIYYKQLGLSYFVAFLFG